MIKLLLAIALILLKTNVQLKLNISLYVDQPVATRLPMIKKYKNVKWFITYFSQLRG